MEELTHFQKLHDKITDIIKKYREENGEPPAEMLAIWKYEHENFIELVTEIKVKQNIYKGA